MNKLVIFDLDGTLIHSLPDIAYNLNLALKKFGYKPKTDAEVMNFIGNGARRLVKDSMGEGTSENEVDECLKYYNDLYTSSDSPKTRLFDGVEQLLKELNKREFKLAILTNKPQMTTDKIYQTHLKQFNFDIVLGQSQRFTRKPDKASTEFILKTLDVLPENCYFIGDGETDFLTAKNSGVNSISVLWGYRSKAQLEQAGAKTFVQIPKEILSILGV